jgi:hypothetical protein
MRRFVSLAVFAAAVGGALAASASGARPATEQEAASLASAVGLPTICIAGTISTADESWAGVTETDAAGCSPGNGIDVLQLANGSWTQVTAGSDFGTCPVSNVPTPVAKDLALCRDPQTIVLCANKNATYRLPRIAPSRCDTLGPQQSFNEGANLARLRWKGWGRAVATTTGVDLGYHLPFEHIRVQVRAYRLRRQCGDGDNLYTRLKIRSQYGTTLVRFPAC